MIITIIFTGSNGDLPIHDSSTFAWSILLLFMLITGYAISLCLLYKKNNFGVLLNLVVYIFFIFAAPTIMSKYETFISTPSVKEQRKIINLVSDEIKTLNLPYSIDFDQSHKDTKRYGGRVAVILIKTVDGDVQEGEVDSILSNIPAGEVVLTIYSKNKDNFIALALDENRRIKQCVPYEICKKFNIKY
ncbi:hypothetical protein KCTCHS21_25610 [Cohnella abietis]|uniref:Uncharacterized protein n=1 Tax=Cohnella abietis TaxID=2507935 RepID=A0A3T1D4X3_9BACL|nr:hypothetical protein KCTCHS21_25610 [Cohnella abietis]